MLARKIASLILGLSMAALVQGGMAEAAQAQASTPGPTPEPDVRRVVDLGAPGEAIYLDAERPISIDLRALIPNGRYRSRSLFPGHGVGWRTYTGFTLGEPHSTFGEVCIARYRALKAVFDAPNAVEAVRLREVYAAGTTQSGCPQLEPMMVNLAKDLTPQLAYGLSPPNPNHPKAKDPMRLQVERIDEAGNVLQAYEWPIVLPRAQAIATETSWIVGQVAGRIAAIVTGSQVATSLVEASAGQFAVRLDATEHEINTAPGVWNPATYVALAMRLGVPRVTGAVPVHSNDMAAALTTPTIATLVAVDKELGLAFRSDRLNPVTHESAALFLVTVALRSAVDGLEDIRPLLNRAAAHLAIAAAASGPRFGVEGELARAGIEVLSDRQVAAAALLNRSRARLGSAAARSWYRALMMRATGDWRLYRPTGRPNLLEQMEHARALARSWSPARAAEFWRNEAVHKGSAVWGRAILTRATVELGNEMAGPHLQAEMSEAAALARLFGHDDLPAWLRAEAKTGGLDPIPESLWARLSDASIADGAMRFHDYLDGLPPSPVAEQFRGEISGDFPQSPAIQALAHRWLALVPAPEVTDRCEELARRIKENPFRLSARAWEYARQGCEHLGRSFPSADTRLTPWTPAGTLFDFKNRVEIRSLLPAVFRSDWSALRLLTFYEPAVLRLSVGQAEQRNPTGADFRQFSRERPYSLSLLRDWSFVTSRRGDVRESLEPGRAACRLDTEECLGLVDLLRSEGKTEEAYSTAMRVFGPGRDVSVNASNEAAWIIDENVRRGNVAAAEGIAARAARKGSYAGLLVRARLVERLGDHDQAGRLYAELDQAYETSTSAEFALRQIARQGKGRDAIVEALRPIGEPATSMLSTGEAVTGFIVSAEWLERMGPVGRAEVARMKLPFGSVITAVNEFQIANEAQFWAVLSLEDNPTIEARVRSEGVSEPLAVRGPFSRADYGPISRRK